MVRQFHSIDRIFLDLENEQISMGVTPLYFYDPRGMDGDKFSLGPLLDHLDKCARSIPVMCGKLHRTMFDLDNPYLVKDPDYDIKNHVIHETMDNDTDIKELSKRINDFQAAHMNTDGPIWEALVLSGINIKTLPKDCFVIALKLHHAIADGMTVIDLTGKINGLTEIGDPVCLPTDKSLTLGGPFSMVARVLSNNIRQSFKLVNPLLKVGPQFGLKALNYCVESVIKSNDSNPRTRFSGKVSNNRVWGYSSFDLSEIKRIKSLLPGCTVNDVIVTIVTGGLREYLLSKNELPNCSVRVMSPINVRSTAEQSQAGNEISMMSLELPVHIEEPLAQLISVIKSNSRAKEEQNKLGSRNVSELAKNLPAAYLSFMRNVTGNVGTNKVLDLLGNLTITNVPGPAKELNMLGATLVDMSAIVPIQDGMGVIHGVVSYAGKINVSVSSCEEMIPDMKHYIRCLDRSLIRLQENMQSKCNVVSITKTAS